MNMKSKQFNILYTDYQLLKLKTAGIKPRISSMGNKGSAMLLFFILGISGNILLSEACAD